MHFDPKACPLRAALGPFMPLRPKPEHFQCRAVAPCRATGARGPTWQYRIEANTVFGTDLEVVTS